MYVDDFIHSVKDTHLAYIIYEQIKFNLGDVSFNRRKWKTSVYSLQDRFKVEADNESMSFRNSADDSLLIVINKK